MAVPVEVLTLAIADGFHTKDDGTVLSQPPFYIYFRGK